MPNVIALTVLGTFFTTSGYRKIFLPYVRNQVFTLFRSHGVPDAAGVMVVVGEFLGGLGLLSGLFVPWLYWIAAIGLLPIMLGAYFLDTLPGIKAKHPENCSAWVSHCMCNAEFLLLILLLVVITE